ncbi:hypothetical protein BDW22DRAFT_1364034 [Trametopsis cervina]|nr:hypothetical protein BDW22DRAFT_1364034 [Trametopsis cervina]
METRRCSSARLCVPGSSPSPRYKLLTSAALPRPHAERASCTPSAPTEETQHVGRNQGRSAWVEFQRGSSASSTSTSNAARVFWQYEYISCQFCRATNSRPFHVPHGIFVGREISYGHLASTDADSLKVHPFSNRTRVLSSYAYAQTYGVKYHPIFTVLVVRIIYHACAAVFPGGEILDLEQYQARHDTIKSRTYAQRGSRSSLWSIVLRVLVPTEPDSFF